VRALDVIDHRLDIAEREIRAAERLVFRGRLVHLGRA
jgi:hypothetical protein